MHSLDLILTLTGGLAAALAGGYLTNRVGLSPIVGYLFAGILVGPHTPGFVADQALAEQLAEIGVILLMFGVGLHFHVKELLAVRRSRCRAPSSRAWSRRLSASPSDACGWALAGGPRLRPRHVGRQHRRAGARPRRQPRAAHAGRPHRRSAGSSSRISSRSSSLVLHAGGLRRRAGRRASRWPARHCRRSRSSALVAFTIVVGGRVIPLAAGPRRRHPVPRAVHAHRAGRGARHRRRLGASCSACRWPSARSWPAWSSAARSSACGPPPTPCRCATPSRSSSSSRSGCCSTRWRLLARPHSVARGAGRRSWSGSRWPRSPSSGWLGYPLRVALPVAIALAQIGEFSFILANLGTSSA